MAYDLMRKTIAILLIGTCSIGCHAGETEPQDDLIVPIDVTVGDVVVKGGRESYRAEGIPKVPPIPIRRSTELQMRVELIAPDGTRRDITNDEKTVYFAVSEEWLTVTKGGLVETKGIDTQVPAPVMVTYNAYDPVTLERKPGGGEGIAVITFVQER